MGAALQTLKTYTWRIGDWPHCHFAYFTLQDVRQLPASTDTSSIFINSNKSHDLIFFHPLENPTQKDSSLGPDCEVQLNTQTHCIILEQFPTACQEQEFYPSPNALNLSTYAQTAQLQKTTSNRRDQIRNVKFSNQFSLNRTFITM